MGGSTWCDSERESETKITVNVYIQSQSVRVCVCLRKRVCENVFVCVGDRKRGRARVEREKGVGGRNGVSKRDCYA